MVTFKPTLSMLREQNKSSSPALVGVHILAPGKRLAAIRYSQDDYHDHYLAPSTSADSRPFRSRYHSSGKIEQKGTLAERDCFLADMRSQALSVSSDEMATIDSWVSNQAHRRSGAPVTPWECITSLGNSRAVALGLAYASAMLDNTGVDSALHYSRGFGFAAGWSKMGLISGRFATIDRLGVNQDLIDNFKTVKKPTACGVREQQGILLLRQNILEDMDDTSSLAKTDTASLVSLDNMSIIPAAVDVNWTPAYNDTYYLFAVLFGRPIYLASPRIETNMYRQDDSGGLTMMGRENAIIWGSEAYELHSTRSMGDVFVFAGAPVKGDYTVGNMLQAIRRHIFDVNYKQALSWMGTYRQRLQQGEVLVIELQVMEGGSWTSSRERGRELAEEE